MQDQAHFSRFHEAFMDAWIQYERRWEKEAYKTKDIPLQETVESIPAKKPFEFTFVFIAQAYAEEFEFCLFGGWPSIINPATKKCRTPWGSTVRNALAGDDRYKEIKTYGPYCGRRNTVRCNPIIFGAPGSRGDFKGHCVKVKNENEDWSRACKNQAMLDRCGYFKRLYLNKDLQKEYFENVARIEEFCGIGQNYYSNGCMDLVDIINEMNVEEILCAKIDSEDSLYFNQPYDSLVGDIKTMTGIPNSIFSMNLMDRFSEGISNSEGSVSLFAQQEAIEIADILEDQVDYFVDKNGKRFPRYCQGALDSEVIKSREEWTSLFNQYSSSDEVKKPVTYIIDKAKSSSIHQCATYIKRALVHGGLMDRYKTCNANVCNEPLKAAGMVNLMENEDFLKAYGLDPDDSDGICDWLESDDAPIGLVVMSDARDSTSQYGHLEMKTGADKWHSDFSQNSIVGCARNRWPTGLFIREVD